jgi:hypothetical protein
MLVTCSGLRKITASKVTLCLGQQRRPHLLDVNVQFLFVVAACGTARAALV